MTETPLILSLETATLGGSVCMSRGKTVLSVRLGDAQISHSSSLLTDIQQSLEEAGNTIEDVDLFAAASGPGSFTGLRIGLATLKGLAETMARPCVGVPTLEAIALAAGPSEATVTLLPAGRGELFAQLHSVSADGQVSELDAAAHLSPEKVLEKYASRQNLRWAGEGAHLHWPLISQYAGDRGRDVAEVSSGAQPVDGWTLAPREPRLAIAVAALALQKSRTGALVTPEMLRAMYVRPSDPELKEQAR